MDCIGLTGHSTFASDMILLEFMFFLWYSLITFAKTMEYWHTLCIPVVCTNVVANDMHH